MSNYEKGRYGEEQACEYIENKGYEIIERNYQASFGEIDIIAKDKDYIIFIEVKYRKNLNKGYPREAVGKRKQKNVRNVAINYIIENSLNDCNFRFDVIEILGNNIEQIENAF